MKEIWKDINGYEGIYQVSNLGKVKSISREVKHKGLFGNKEICHIKEKILSQNTDGKRGYLKVSLIKNGKTKHYFVHRLVAMAFIENTHNKEQVNHINGIKTDNTVKNLEWCTNKENLQHSWKKGLRSIDKSYYKGKEHHNSLGVKQYDKQGIFIKEWYCINDAMKSLNKRGSGISRCCKGQNKTAYGYKWKYA